MFEVTYKYGHGHFAIDLDRFLPCTSSDFKKVLKMVNMSADPDVLANELYVYISGQVQELTAKKSGMDPEHQVADIATINALIKRYLPLADLLTSMYGTPAISDPDASIKMTACTVYAIHGDQDAGEQPHIVAYDGWTFEKSGHRFEVYKSDRNLYRYLILLAGTGLQVAGCRKKQDITTAVTPHIIDVLTNDVNQQKIQYAIAYMRRLMVDAGYIDPEESDSNKQDRDQDQDRNANRNRNENQNENQNENKEGEAMKKNYFNNVKTLEELRTLYRDFLKTVHPDNGGSVEACQELNAQYDATFERLKNSAPVMDGGKEQVKWDATEDAALRDALSKIIHIKDINIEIVGCWIWVDGITYPAKDDLKCAGFKWSKARKKWHFAPYEHKYYKGGKKSFDDLRRTYGSSTVETESREEIA